MANITLAMDDALLQRGREFAGKQGLSFNAWVRQLVEQNACPQTDWLDELMDVAQHAQGNSHGWKWNREEIQRNVCA
jgi:hypothetical protein